MDGMLSNKGATPVPGTKTPLPKPQGHHCFACGTANPIGLHLDFYKMDNFICSDITLGKQYEGWENMAHGGIVSTLLDEVMSWTLIYFKKAFFVTRKMQTKYVRPILIGQPLKVKGRILKEDGKIVTARGEVLSAQGSLLARSEAEFVMVSEEKLSSVPEGLKKDMKDLFEKMEQV